MRQVWIARYGGPECLELREAVDPQPGPGEVRVRVRAAGINFADILGRMGLYPDAPKGPYVPGYEISGEIDAVGPGTERSCGERVLAFTRFGGYSDVICVSGEQAVPMPDGMSFEAAAALPVQYLTAYHMIVTLGGLRSDETLFVHGIGGGVGLASLQLGRWIGAAVLGTASRGKHAALKELGVDTLFGYDEEDLARSVRAATDGVGAHVVLDPVGGKSFRTSYRMLAQTGRMFAYGISALAKGKRRNKLGVFWQLLRMPKFRPLHMMHTNRSVAGVNLGRLWNAQALLRRQMAEIIGLWGEGHLAPRISETFPLEQASQAHHFIQDRKNLGKVLLTA